MRRARELCRLMSLRCFLWFFRISTGTLVPVFWFMFKNLTSVIITATLLMYIEGLEA